MNGLQLKADKEMTIKFMGISVWKRQLQEELSFLAMDCLPLGGPITSYCVECMPMFKDTYKVYVALKTFGIPAWN